jgi:hypothetical protein
MLLLLLCEERHIAVLARCVLIACPMSLLVTFNC